jgi:hypothetical protein
MKLKILYWASRVLAILAILFMMIFSMDCFGGFSSVKEQIICFLIHNIPACIVIVVLIIAWKWELAGGILFLLVAAAGSIYFRAFSGNPGALVVFFPFVITGFIFILHQILSVQKKHIQSLKKR